MTKQSKLVIVEPDKGAAGDLLSFLSPEKVYRALAEANITPERIIGAIGSIACDGQSAAKDRLAALKMLLALPREALAASGELQSVTARAERTLPGGTASVEVRGISAITPQEATMALLAQGGTKDIDLEGPQKGVGPELIPQGGQNGHVQRPTGSGVATGGPGDSERRDNPILPVSATGGTESGPDDPGNPPTEGPGSIQGRVQQAGSVGSNPQSIIGGGIGNAGETDGTSTTDTEPTSGGTTGTTAPAGTEPDGGVAEPGGPVEPDGRTAPKRSERGRPNRNPSTGKFTGPQPITHGRGSYSFVPPGGPSVPTDPLGVFSAGPHVPTGNPNLGWTDTPDDGVPDIGDTPGGPTSDGSPTGTELAPGGPVGKGLPG